MRVFITGATGWIGSAVAAELVEAGHDVRGLARSDANVEKLEAAGIRPHRGDLRDVASLRAGAEGSDAVIHFGNLHDFSDMAESGRVERQAVETFGDVLAGTGAALVIASGMATAGGTVLTESDASPHVGPQSLRGGAEHLALSYADRDIRAIAVRFAPTVHGIGDHGFIAHIAQIARDRGVVGYIGDGSNRWPAVHRLDAAHLVRLALDEATAGTIAHAVAESGVPARDIAEALSAALGLPTASIPRDDATAHFGWIAMFFGTDIVASSEATRKRFGWVPTHPTLLEDIASGGYTV